MNVKEMPASIDFLDEAMTFIDAFLEEVGCTEDEKRYIEVSAEELFTNIASYAYEQAGGMVRISVSLIKTEDEPAVSISFFDRGRPYNPFAREDPDLDLPLSERPIGGLGVYMVKQFMDIVNYSYDSGCNVTTMIKKVGRDGNGKVL